VGAESDADWNTFCGLLDSSFDPEEKRVANLSTGEARALIDLLERHHCLGLLADKTYDERVDAFMGRADRQILVALHELTQGKPFEEIVFAEHQSVHPEQARQLYLDIATMHQFGVNSAAYRLRDPALHPLNTRMGASGRNPLSGSQEHFRACALGG